MLVLRSLLHPKPIIQPVHPEPKGLHEEKEEMNDALERNRG